ncbi:PREDICTED: uncharacterized protein LOC105368907 [Ceratosolen solmsi marchali]|uniref:Uncharacterized protein LOC105368907 n=1 Tax=Ceratosolen solmsi marchali TaxID=326594 RepID=A0AAJ6YXW7_9HYME|nr:PREDICTED: uncharacterized protein LOC105368907 [Ceratosolen solmsi marchali]
MAGVLGSCGTWNVDSVISFLIVATGQLCDKIFEALETTSKIRKYRIAVHKCECIYDILRSKPDLQIDFIIFAFDGRISQRVNEVERGINLLDEFFVISGRICLVNCYDLPNNMGLIGHTANRLRDKYCLRLISANVYNCEGLKSLGDRIFNLSEALMGIHSGIPDLNLLSIL